MATGPLRQARYTRHLLLLPKWWPETSTTTVTWTSPWGTRITPRSRFGWEMGTFSSTGSYNDRSVAVGDLDADGHLDLVTTDNWAGAVSVLQGVGTGTFLLTTNYAAGYSPSRVTAADLDAD